MEMNEELKKAKQTSITSQIKKKSHSGRCTVKAGRL